MTQKQEDKTGQLNRLKDENGEGDLAYENESYVSNLPGEVPTGNNVGAASLVATRALGTKWNHLVKKRRASKLPFYIRSEEKVGLDDDTEAVIQTKNYNEKQIQLNKALMTHFINLAKHNDSNDEVNLDFIEDLLKKGADINCCDKHGQGMIHEAAREWHTDILLFLLESGANVNLADDYHRTALHIAAAVDYPEMVELLVDRGAYIEARTKGENQTPLHYAAKNDAASSLKMLIHLGAELEAKDYKDRTPMYVAAEMDRSETAKYLLEIKADVKVKDSSGQMCMTHMITKMGPVAKPALDQFHTKDRANRRQYFHLNLLEVPRGSKGKKASLAKTPLEVIVRYRQLDIIMHPVIMRLIDIKWELFGRRIAFRELLFNFIFVLIWTILGVATPWQFRYRYTFPQEWWRVFLLLIGCMMTAYYVYDEVQEFISLRKQFKIWKSWRKKLLEKEMEFCHPKWPKEKKYLQSEMETFDELFPTYFQDFWNYFDWMVYFCIFLVVLLHIVDASLTSRVPPCCSLTAPCNNFTISVCDDGFVNNANLSAWHNRFFVLTIFFLWLRMMKFTRAFKFFGPFIVVLSNLSWDILRFLYLYLEFYIPYACGFWMIFGNIDSIATMKTVDQMLFSLFRITLVDEYQFPEMQTYDVVMAYILVSSFLAVSAILCINLFIALLSDTFQRVYDNANANAVMQRAALMLNFEQNLRKSKKIKLKKYIEEKCSPESLFYDDDLTLPQDSQLKKVTIQLKEQMDELMSYVRKEDYQKNDASDIFGVSSKNTRSGKIKSKSGGGLSSIVDLLSKGGAPAVKASDDGGASSESMQKMSSKIVDLTSRIQKLQVSQTTQENSYKQLSTDVKDIKAMLSTLVQGNGKSASGNNDKNEHSTLPRNVARQPSESQPSSTKETSKGGAAGLFKKLLGGASKAKPISPQAGGVAPLFHQASSDASNRDRSATPTDAGVEVISLFGAGTTPSNRQTPAPPNSSNV